MSASESLLANATRDSLWQGRLPLWQPARREGYRFNLDPVLLAGFVEPADHLLDLGAGCGILGLLLLRLGRVERVTAVEVQPQLAALARRNGEEHGHPAERFSVVCGDLRHVECPPAQAVAFNPPYFAAAAGQPAPNRGRDAARHERNGTLDDFVSVAATTLAPGGSLFAIVPAARGDELRTLCTNAGLAAHRVRRVLPRVDEAPNHLLLEARRGGVETNTEEPLVVHARHGEFSAEVLALVDGPA